MDFPSFNYKSTFTHEPPAFPHCPPWGRLLAGTKKVAEESILESGQTVLNPGFALGISRKFLFILLRFSFLISKMGSLMPTSQIVVVRVKEVTRVKYPGHHQGSLLPHPSPHPIQGT